MNDTKQSMIQFQVRKSGLRKCRKSNRENQLIVSTDCKNESVKRNLFENNHARKKIKILDFAKESGSEQKSPIKSAIQLNKQDTSPLQAAKQVFHTSLPSRFVGRQQEIREIASFLHQHLSQRNPVSMYVSGAPGTGKTSCLMHVIKNLDMKFNSVFVNCMTVNTSQSIYKTIADELGVSSCSNRDIEKSIENHLTSSKDMTVLILDEIDHLDSKGQEVLYSLFEWPRLPRSTLILIGVANALDLTDRVLPRLQSFKYEPVLMHFKPYSHEQITKILEDRLADLQNSTTVFRPSAIHLCARKIAACTGDIRKALQVCRRAIELAEKQAKAQRILSRNCENSPVKQAPPPVIVDLVHVTSVLGEVYGSRMQVCSSPYSSKTVTLPLQQVILLCSLILMKKNLKSKDMNFGKLYDVYKRICKKRQISEVGESEFFSLCQLVEVRGFIHLSRSKIPRLTKIVLKIDEKETENILQDKNLLSSILADTSVIACAC